MPDSITCNHNLTFTLDPNPDTTIDLRLVTMFVGKYVINLKE